MTCIDIRTIFKKFEDKLIFPVIGGVMQCGTPFDKWLTLFIWARPLQFRDFRMHQ